MYFSDIADELKYPAKYSRSLRAEHMKIIKYGTAHFQTNRQWQKRILHLMNTVTCSIIQNEAVAIDYEQDDLISQITPLLLEDNEVKKILSRYYCDQLYINWIAIEWDIAEAAPVVSKEAPAPTSAKAAPV